MALVVLPEGTQISGSAGGTTWSRNRYGAYKRNRSVPVNTNTDRQVLIRNLVKALTIGWANDLDQAQRDAWEVYAANVAWKNHLGQDVFLTGLNHYVRSNVPRMQCELDRVDAAPVIFNLAVAEQALVVSGSEGSQDLSLGFDDTAAWCDEDGGFEVFYMGIPQNASIKFFGGPYRMLCCAPGETGVKAVAVVEGKGAKAPLSGEGKVAKAVASGEVKQAKAAKPCGGKRVKEPPSTPLDCPGVWPFAEGQRIWVRSRIGRADGRLSEFAQCNFLAAV